MSSRSTMRETRSPTASTRSSAGAITRITPSTRRRMRTWSGVMGATPSPAPLVEVELGQRGLRDLGGDLLRLVQVAGADRQVVDRHDPDEALSVDHGQAADAVL